MPLDVGTAGLEAPTTLPVESFWADVLRVYDTEAHPALALCIRHRGEVVLDRVVGAVDPTLPAEADNRATPDTLFNLFSASKILTATVIHSLVEQGRMSLDDRVADTLPAFGHGGKEAIRLHHLLHHNAGMPNMPADLDPEAALSNIPSVVARLAELPLTSAPGEAVAYHPMSAWAVISELVRHRIGRDLRSLAHELVSGPMGLERFNYGVSEADLPRVAKHVTAGVQGVPVMESIFQRTVGVPSAEAVRISNTPEFLQAVLPSANVIATPRETSAFMQMLLDGGTWRGTRILKPATVYRMVQDETPRAFDGTFGFPMRYGLGMMKGGRRFSLFGPFTRRAFGHLGFSNVLVYADPDRQLVMVLLNTGKPLLAWGMVPWAVLVQKIALMVPRRR
jgi:CubicO group peptidase (beta-lactamase class C family)